MKDCSHEKKSLLDRFNKSKFDIEKVSTRPTFYHFKAVAICSSRDSCFVFIYFCWCLRRLSYQMMFVLFNNNSTSAISGSTTAYPSGEPVVVTFFYCTFSSSSFLCTVLPTLFDSSFCPFVGHCIVCPLLYGFWSPFWYLEAFVALRMEHTFITFSLFTQYLVKVIENAV